jgi:hypothetical protein
MPLLERGLLSFVSTEALRTIRFHLQNRGKNQGLRQCAQRYVGGSGGTKILRDDVFLEVIAHWHFNPRLIEWLSASTRLLEVPGAEYQAQFRDMLANPPLDLVASFSSNFRRRA